LRKKGGRAGPSGESADKNPVLKRAMKKFLVGINVVNEGEKIKRVIAKFSDYAAYDVLILDDGSTDGSLNDIRQTDSLRVIRNDTCRGAGYTTRQIIDYAHEKGYPYVIFVSGNDKDSPEDIPKLVAAVETGYDFVQGSRYLPGGAHGNMPLYRKVATRYLHPLLFSLLTGQRITDSTNGFRAMRTALAYDARMVITQPWLDGYELEPYLFYYAIKLGYKVKEVPVKKVYPPHTEGYTKMRPFVDWWSILRPLVYLGLRIKR